MSYIKRRWPLTVIVSLIVGGPLLVEGLRSRYPNYYFNLTRSAPYGVYRLEELSSSPGRGEMVIFRPPPAYRAGLKRLGAYRKYPTQKYLAAIPGDTVCVKERKLYILGKPWGPVHEYTAGGKKLPSLLGCKTLGADEYLPLSPLNDSLDGRYLGTIRREDILGQAKAVFTFYPTEFP